MHNIHIAFACDDGYAKLTGVALQSLLDSIELAESSALEDISLVVYVVDLGIHENSIDKLKEIASGAHACPVSLVLLPFDIIAAMEPVWQTQTFAYHPQCFATFFLTELLPEECERVIYLDCDVLVRHSIFDLWRVELGDYSLAAAREICADAKRLHGFWRRSCHPAHLMITGGSYVANCLAGLAKPAALQAAEPILNSGVMVMNLARLRELDFKRSLIDLCVKYLGASAAAGDQDMISLFLEGQYMELPYRWNTHFFLPPPYHVLMLSQREREEALLGGGPRIVHFSGPISRPWVRSTDPEHQFHAEWVRALDATPWAGWRPTKAADSILARLFAMHHDTKDIRRKGSSSGRGGGESAGELEAMIGNPGTRRG